MDRPAGTSTAASLARAVALAAIIRARSRLANGAASTSFLPLLLLIENVIDLAGGRRVLIAARVLEHPLQALRQL